MKYLMYTNVIFFDEHVHKRNKQYHIRYLISKISSSGQRKEVNFICVYRFEVITIYVF